MDEDIHICGIKTNNLKNIDVTIRKNSLNLIIGPSGSGKSSLAYDTIAQIGLHELNSLCGNVEADHSYKVDSYENFLVTVPIKQTNTNSNVHSTIGTYFNLNHNIISIFSSILQLPYSFFILNTSENICPNCKGLGTIKKPDVQKIINYNIPLNKNPFRCYNIHKDFYCEIIKNFCDEIGIDSSKSFKDLSEQEISALLYGTSSKKYQIKYKRTKYIASRTTYYYGVLLDGKRMMPDFNLSEKYYSDVICPDCSGEKYCIDKRKFKVCNKSIGEVLNLPFNELLVWLEHVKKEHQISELDFLFNTLLSFCKKASELQLHYLFLNRSIPTLSGGEFQRLRLTKLFNSQLKDLLIILDEPLAGLSHKEKEIVYDNIKLLIPQNTLVIVDHHDVFFGLAKNIITLGEKSGALGGYVINTDRYLKSLNKEYTVIEKSDGKEESIAIDKKIYKYNGIRIGIKNGCLNLITGPSGIGKSSLLREYLPLYYDDYEYINQRPLFGNKDSNVATTLGIFTLITNIFSKEFKKDRTFFSNHLGDKGACPACRGSGFQSYDSLFNDFQFECKECKGTGFNQELQKYKVKSKSIIDILSMTIDEAAEYFAFDKKIYEILKMASSVLLGSIKLSQKTSTLSGGENVRIKIIKSIRSTSQFLGIDEPFRGLNKNEIYMVALFLSSLVKKGRTIIVVDHEEEAFKYFSKIINLRLVDNYLIE